MLVGLLSCCLFVFLESLYYLILSPVSGFLQKSIMNNEEQSHFTIILKMYQNS